MPKIAPAQRTTPFPDYMKIMSNKIRGEWQLFLACLSPIYHLSFKLLNLKFPIWWITLTNNSISNLPYWSQHHIHHRYPKLFVKTFERSTNPSCKRIHRSTRIIEANIPPLHAIEPEPPGYQTGKEQARDRFHVTQTKHALRILLCYAIEPTQAIFYI